MSVIPRKNGVHTRRAAIVNHPAVVNLLRVAFLVRQGPLEACRSAFVKFFVWHELFCMLALHGRLIFIHHQCWEVLPFCRFQRQRCIKIRVLRAQDFYTPLALKAAKGQHLPALVVYKNQSPTTEMLQNPPIMLGIYLFCGPSSRISSPDVPTKDKR